MFTTEGTIFFARCTQMFGSMREAHPPELGTKRNAAPTTDNNANAFFISSRPVAFELRQTACASRTGAARGASLLPGSGCPASFPASARADRCSAAQARDPHFQ